MPEFGIFMLPSEIGWLRAIIKELHLASYTANEVAGIYRFIKADMVEPKSFDERCMFLSSFGQKVEDAQQTRHLIRIWLPVTDGGNLCMSTIAISKPRINSLLEIYRKNLASFSVLVRRLKSDCWNGMFISNSETKDSNWNPRIAVSRGALGSVGNFAALKPVFCDTFIEYVLPEDATHVARD